MWDESGFANAQRQPGSGTASSTCHTHHQLPAWQVRASMWCWNYSWPLDFIFSKLYLEAFDIMRKQRINLNLIFDHKPQIFMESMKEFVLQIKNPTWLCLFLTDLMWVFCVQLQRNILITLFNRETDVTLDMYAGHYPNKQPLNLPNGESKLEFVCSRMRQVKFWNLI